MNNSTSRDTIVKLNVGGQMFQTTPTTLKESEFFTRMLEGSIPTMKDETGAYFIDRDPKYFEIILSFMRTFKWDIPPTIRKDRVLQEAEFYLLRTTESLADHEKKSPAPCGLYTFKKDTYFFIYNGHCISNIIKTKESVVVSKNVASLKKSSSCIGMFVNDNQNFIMRALFMELLKKNWSRKPIKLITQTIKRPHHANIIIKADPEIVMFYQNDQKLSDCLYEADATTEFVFAKHNSPHLKIEVYFFGDRMIVDLNGDLKYYTGDSTEK